jgi:hypothetical protein
MQLSLNSIERQKCQRRAVYAINFRIAAEVSSIDRRVTSSSAQLNLALSLRANATYRARQALLANAGIAFEAITAGIDEREIQRS